MGEPFQRALARLVSRLDSVSRIALRDLGRDEVATLLASLGQPDPPTEIVDVIYRETEGNPFFVQSVYRHLAEEGLLFDADGHWRSDLDAESLAVPERRAAGHRPAPQAAGRGDAANPGAGRRDGPAIRARPGRAGLQPGQ